MESFAVGCVGFSTDKIVKTMLESFNDFICGPEYKTYLRAIKLVVYEKSDLDVVISEMMKFFSPGKKQAGGCIFIQNFNYIIFSLCISIHWNILQWYMS